MISIMLSEQNWRKVLVLSSICRKPNLNILITPLSERWRPKILINLTFSEGIIMGWCSAMFSRETIFKSRFAIIIKFTAKHNAET
jgi:hypothetical protein